MKGLYEKAEIIIIEYNKEDILTASPGNNENELPLIPLGDFEL